MEQAMWGALPADWWTPALPLHERLAGRRDRPAARPEAVPADEARLARWRAAYPHLTGDTLALQSAGFGVDVADVEHGLSAPADGTAKPAWAELTERILRHEPAEPPTRAGWRRRWQDDFAAILSPFVYHAVSEAAPSPPTVRAAFRSHVTERLVAVASRTLVLRLHEMSVAGCLTGDTPEARFGSFADALGSRAELCALLVRYPVLARLLTTIVDQEAAAYREFIARVSVDHADSGPLAELTFGAGDPHDRGRSVLLLRFASGERLVYKPRALAVHVHFNEVLAWFEKYVPEAAPRRLRVSDRGAYGWVEFVEPAACADAAGAERYFFRLGAQLALLYALAGTDFHYENVIAAGDQPVLLDLETLLHVGLPVLTGRRFADTDPAAEVLDTSVAAVGLLPAVIGGVVDVGGLGGDIGALSPFPSAGWEDGGTDRMRLVRVRRPMPDGNNKVLIDGRAVEPAQYAEEICAGFRIGYRAIAEHRGELLDLLGRFSGDEVRVLVRPTRTYARLLDETTHPDVLADALDRDRALGILWALADSDPGRRALAAAEARDIWNADIPLLRTRAGSRDIRACDGVTTSDVQRESGIARAARVIAGMGDDDLERQEWIVRATLATRAAVPRRLRPLRPVADGADADPGTGPRDRALALARAAADRVAAMAPAGGNRMSWLGLDLGGADQWQVTPVGQDLFGGTAGIGLFFAQLANVTGEEKYAAPATRILRSLHTYLDELLEGPSRRRPRPGAFSGEAGIAYALAAASVLLGEPALADPVRVLLRALGEAVETDADVDVMSGAAGCLSVAEALVPCFAEAAGLASACAQVLIERAIPVPDGIAWRTPVTGERPLTGFSHGAGGIAWALARHAARTGDQAARSTAWSAFAYERACYSPAIGNWPDFRTTPSRPWNLRDVTDGTAHMHAWCHGAPGIGLARTGVAAAMRTPGIEDDLRLALESTTAFGPFGNHSLCHGDLGNLELFTAAAPNSADVAAERARRISRVLTDLTVGGPVCGTPAGLPTPGLMTGLAGIGHGLLRIAAPGTVASVLLLQEQR